MKFYQVIQTFSKLDVNKTGVPDKRAFIKKKGEAIRLARKWNHGARVYKPAKPDSSIARVSKDGLIRIQIHSMRGAEVVAFINSLVDPQFTPRKIQAKRRLPKPKTKKVKGKRPVTKSKQQKSKRK